MSTCVSSDKGGARADLFDAGSPQGVVAALAVCAARGGASLKFPPSLGRTQSTKSHAMLPLTATLLLATLYSRSAAPTRPQGAVPRIWHIPRAEPAVQLAGRSMGKQHRAFSRAPTTPRAGQERLRPVRHLCDSSSADRTPLRKAQGECPLAARLIPHPPLWGTGGGVKIGSREEGS